MITILDTITRSCCMSKHRTKELQVQGDGGLTEMSVILQCQSVWTRMGIETIICLFNLQEPDSATLELSDSFSDDCWNGR